MITALLLIIAGFVLLILGANWLLNGATSLARRYNISDLVIGLTIVAFGTSAPELVVSMIAAADGHSDIVLGNIIGSNNFNLFIILGAAGLIYPISVQSSTAWREIPIALGVSVLLVVLVNAFQPDTQPVFSRIDGLILLVLFALFLWYVFRSMKAEVPPASAPAAPKSKGVTALLILAGFGGLIFGGQLVVTHSVKIAEILGVSEKIIGLTIVAAGTSLPELMTSVVAALKKNSDVAIGNVIGSNIFNVLLILALSGVIQPISYNVKFNTDLYITIGGTLFLLLAMVTGRRKRLDRWEAAILLVFYIGYTVYLIT